MQGKHLFGCTVILLFGVVSSRSVSKELYELAEKINDRWDINKGTEEEFLKVIGIEHDFSGQKLYESGSDPYFQKNRYFIGERVKNKMDIQQENIEDQNDEWNESIEDSSNEEQIQDKNNDDTDTEDAEKERNNFIEIKNNENRNVKNEKNYEDSQEYDEKSNDEDDYDRIENEDIKKLEQDDDHDGDNAVFGVLDYLNDKGSSEDKPDDYEYKEDIEKYTDMDYIPDDYFDNSEYER